MLVAEVATIVVSPRSAIVMPWRAVALPIQWRSVGSAHCSDALRERPGSVAVNSPVSWSKATDREVVKEAMEAVGIGHKAQKFVAELSDGERQKTMIARAVAQQTPVILLDEPTSFLDVASRVDVLQLLHKLAREEGKAILLSSHDVSLSLSLSDRLWLLLPGGRLMEGQTEDVVLSGQMKIGRAHV